MINAQTSKNEQRKEMDFTLFFTNFALLIGL